jgi:hypothetical protein
VAGRLLFSCADLVQIGGAADMFLIAIDTLSIKQDNVEAVDENNLALPGRQLIDGINRDQV